MKKYIYCLVLTLLAGNTLHAASPSLKVVTTIFPLYDWIRIVGGEQVELTQLLPPGVEAHGYHPRPSDLIRINQADLFIYLSDEMEPWASDIAKSMKKGQPRIVQVATKELFDLYPFPEGTEHICDHGHHHAAGESPHHHAHQHAHQQDPHVWLDPLLAIIMVQNLAEALATSAPELEAGFRSRADAYSDELGALDKRIQQALADCRHRTILYAGHFAFGHFARRYGLQHVSPYPGFSPNASPSPQAIARLVEAVREQGGGVIFHEELIEPRIARVIAEETGAKMVMLHGAHNTTAAERDSKTTYIEIMDNNLEKLREGLACP